ncbi:MAG: ATP--guanido phosphotransferase, partial [Ruminococcus sp.]|nr:ATP--guanido phosphotransferase [Ruminococcus sp.]
LAAQEEQARERLCKSVDVQDTIARSLGILKYAVVIAHEEALRLLSNVRLGIVSGQIKNIGVDCIDKLMIDVEPATLSVNAGKSLSPRERDTERAKLIKSRLA